MTYSDNGYSFMFVLIGDWQPKWQLHNARGHVAVGLGAEVGAEAKLLDYEIPALGIIAKISTWPVIDKIASEQEMEKLYAELQNEHDKIIVNIFTDSMFGSSAKDQLNQTKNATNPKILAIGLFGERELLKGLTKRLKLASF